MHLPSVPTSGCGGGQWFEPTLLCPTTQQPNPNTLYLSAPQRFNRWIDEQRAASPQTGLSVYPEGHRSLQVGAPEVRLHSLAGWAAQVSQVMSLPGIGTTSAAWLVLQFAQAACSCSAPSSSPACSTACSPPPPSRGRT